MFYWLQHNPQAAVIPAQTAEDVRNIISTLSREPQCDQTNRQTQQKFTIYILMGWEMGIWKWSELVRY